VSWRGCAAAGSTLHFAGLGCFHQCFHLGGVHDLVLRLLLTAGRYFRAVSPYITMYTKACSDVPGAGEELAPGSAGMGCVWAHQSHVCLAVHPCGHGGGGLGGLVSTWLVSSLHPCFPVCVDPIRGVPYGLLIG